MATLAFFAIGSAIGSAAFGSAAVVAGVSAAALTGAAFAAAGSYIDSQYILPAIFKPDSASFRGPRIGDLQVQTATEGTGLHRVYGEYNYVAGTVIWMSDLIEEENTESVGGGGKGGGGGSATSTTYRYYVSIAVEVCRGQIEAIERIKADSKTIYTEADGQGHRTTSVTIYNGSETQLPDPLIESYEGAGNVPAYRGKCYVVIERLALADFGNRVPNLRFRVRKQTDALVSEVITEILQDAGLTTDDFDVSDLPAEELRGYVLDGPSTPVEALEPIMLAYNLVVQEVNGKLRFFKRGEEDHLTIPATALGAYSAGSDERSRPLTLTETSGFDLPSEVTVRYLDTSIGLQQGSQRARRIAPDATNLVGLDVMLTTSPKQARKIAERYLWTSWAERISANLTLGPEYFVLREGDVIDVESDGETRAIRIQSINRGANMIHEITGIVIQASTYVPDDDTGEDGEYVDPSLYLPPTLLSTFFDGPALRPEEIFVPTVYCAACAEDPTATWLGAVLFTSADDISYGSAAAMSVEAKIGVCQTTLAGDDVSTYVWDEINTVDVEFAHGTPTNATAAEVYEGTNWCRIGSEILAFKTATFQSGTTYRLSGLLRGLRDTFPHVATHGASETFVLLQSGSIVADAYSSGSIGVDRYYKAVPVGEDESAISGELIARDGGTCKCFAPTALNATLSSGDWTITWIRVTRAFVRLFAEVVVPNEEPFEQYLVEILDGSSNVVREITVDDATTTTYTSAQQTTDFGSPQTLLRVRVRQIGAIAGRGNATTGSFS